MFRKVTVWQPLSVDAGKGKQMICCLAEENSKMTAHQRNLLRDVLLCDDEEQLAAVFCTTLTGAPPPTFSSVAATGVCNAFIREEHVKLQGFAENLIQKDELDFFRHIRMTKTTFGFVTSVVKEKWVENHPGGNLPVTCTDALLITLWYLGNKSTYREIAEQFGVAESTVYVCVGKVIDILNSVSGQFIKWPCGEEVNNVETKFKEFAGFPGVIGAIDGSHIEIVAPSAYQADYIDRTNRHSVNLMAICDHNKKFTYVSAGFPGSAHDNRVFKSTEFYKALDDNADALFPSVNMHIVGDSAFQVHRHVLVPYKDYGNLSRQQQKYNTKLSKTRCIVENSFALAKGRFRRMKFIDAKVERIGKIIIACCVLHNITLDFPQEEELLTLDGSLENNEEVAFAIPDVNLPVNLIGQEKRDFMAAML